MIYYDDVHFTIYEMNDRISKLVNEITSYYYKHQISNNATLLDPPAKVKIDNPFKLYDSDESEMIKARETSICKSVSDENYDALKRIVRNLVETILPHTRWSNESDIVRFSSNKLLVKWFATKPLMSILRKINGNTVTIISIADDIDKRIRSNENEYRKMLTVTNTGTQTFISSLKYHHFIPGVEYDGYSSYSVYENHGLQHKFFISEFKKYLCFMDEFLLNKPVEDFSGLGYQLSADISYKEMEAYIKSVKYPDPDKNLFTYKYTAEEWNSNNSKHKRDLISIWMMLLALNYCIETFPKSIRYTVKPKRYKNHDLRKAIINSISVKGIFSNIHKKRVKDIVSEVLDKYYDNHPIPGGYSYDTYYKAISFIIDDYDEYCKLLQCKWNDVSCRIYNSKSTTIEYNYSNSDIKAAKEFIFMLSLLDIVSRCQRDIMARFSTYKDIAYAISPFFNRNNNETLDKLFNSNDGYYDLNEYPNLRMILISEFTNSLKSMLNQKTIKNLDKHIKAFRYHILKKRWLHKISDTDNLSAEDIEEILKCARQCALYFIYTHGGYITKASIVYDIYGSENQDVAPIFGRNLSD